MPAVGNVLVVCRDAARAGALKVLLDMAGHSVMWAPSPSEIPAETLQPGGLCILMDVTGVASDEVDAALRRVRDRAPVILIAEAVDVSRGARSLRSEAFDVFDAAFSPSDLLKSVQDALGSATGRMSADLTAFAELTAREQEVLSLLVHGYSAKAIGETLGISPRTVEVHRARIMEKLEARNLPDLVRIVIERSPGPRQSAIR